MTSVLSYANAFPTDNVLARKFNGGTDQISVGLSLTTYLGGPLSWSGWAKVDAGTATLRALFRPPSGNLPAVYIWSDNTFSLYGGSQLATSFTPTVGSWCHLAFTTTSLSASVAGTYLAYANGILVGTFSSITLTSGSGSSILFGEDGFNQGFPGSLTDFAFWNVVLNTTQISNLAAGARANTIGANANLIGYWPITGGSPEPDRSGSGNNGTLTGTVLGPGGPATLGLV